MGWELRHGERWYLYRNRRVNGKPVKEYLGAQDRFGFGALMAHDLDRLQRRQKKLRLLQRKARTDYRRRIDDLLRAASTANDALRLTAEGVLHTLGFHKHKRGEWRMKRDLALLKDAIQELDRRAAERKPVVNYEAPTGDAEAAELFAQVRKGDADAQNRLYKLIRERHWVEWIGDLGRQATRQLIWQAAGGDPVWEVGITEKANALRASLLGDKPTVLEELLVRRVVNGWVATHALELELTVRPPTIPRDREHLDKALTRAQKRFSEAVRELARVRQLKAPAILAQLNVTATQTVVSGVAPVTSATVTSG